MRKLLLIGMLAVLLVAQSVLAKGPPQKVTISGGGLAGEIAVTDDETTLNLLAMMALEDYNTRSSEAPAGISGEGYIITRFYKTDGGEYFPFDAELYYPDPDGGRGYIQYLGIVGGSSDWDGKWFRPTEVGEATLQAVLLRGRVRQEEIRRTAFMTTFMDVMVLFMP